MQTQSRLSQAALLENARVREAGKFIYSSSRVIKIPADFVSLDTLYAGMHITELDFHLSRLASVSPGTFSDGLTARVQVTLRLTRQRWWTSRSLAHRSLVYVLSVVGVGTQYAAPVPADHFLGSVSVSASDEALSMANIYF